MAIKEKFQNFIQNIKEKLNPSPSANKSAEEVRPFTIHLVKDGKKFYTLSSNDTGEKAAKNFSILIQELLNYSFETVCNIYDAEVTIYFVPKKNDIKKGDDEK